MKGGTVPYSLMALVRSFSLGTNNLLENISEDWRHAVGTYTSLAVSLFRIWEYGNQPEVVSGYGSMGINLS